MCLSSKGGDVPVTGDGGLMYNVMTFLVGGTIWMIAAGLLAAAGKIADCVQNERVALARMFVVPFFIVALGMILYGAVIYFLSISPIEPFPFTTTEGIIAIIFLTLAGLIVAFTGIYYRSLVQW